MRAYTDNDGLPQNTVNSVAFDGEGYRWVGTQDGVARNNGRAWHVVQLPRQNVTNVVHAILAGSDGSRSMFRSTRGLARVLAGRLAGAVRASIDYLEFVAELDASASIADALDLEV